MCIRVTFRTLYRLFPLFAFTIPNPHGTLQSRSHER